MKTRNSILICLLIGALFLSLWPLQHPLRSVRATVLDAVFPLFSWFYSTAVHTRGMAQGLNVLDSGALLDEARSLRQRVAQLESMLARQGELRHENERLRALLGFEGGHAEGAVAGRVILNQSGPWVRRFVVDVGIEDSIEQGAAVVVAEGLVGRVAEAGHKTSQVMLLTDPDSAVGVLIQRSRVQGVFEGRPDGTGSIEYVPKDADVRVQDMVLTSGLGGVFSKGIRVGQVISVTAHPGGLFKTVRVRPSVDFSRLEEVVCIPLESSPSF